MAVYVVLTVSLRRRDQPSRSRSRAGSPSTKIPEQPTSAAAPMARPPRRLGPARLRELAGLALTAVSRSLLASRGRWRSRARRQGTTGRGADARRLHALVALLVRIVPELAERVSLGGRPRHSRCICASAVPRNPSRFMLRMGKPDADSTRAGETQATARDGTARLASGSSQSCRTTLRRASVDPDAAVAFDEPRASGTCS